MPMPAQMLSSSSIRAKLTWIMHSYSASILLQRSSMCIQLCCPQTAHLCANKANARLQGAAFLCTCLTLRPAGAIPISEESEEQETYRRGSCHPWGSR